MDGSERKGTLFESAYAALKQAILENELPPGYQGSEQEIANRLGMSRTPVHEAIVRLQQEGLMEIRPKKGVIVSTIAPDDMKEIYDIRIALEGMAAELIALLEPEERNRAVSELTEPTARMEKAVLGDDLLAWAEADNQFHRGVVEACGNSRLSKMANLISSQLHRTRLITLRVRTLPKHSAGDHYAIIEAIRDGDAALAREQASGHCRRARDELIPLLKQSGIRHL